MKAKCLGHLWTKALETGKVELIWKTISRRLLRMDVSKDLSDQNLIPVQPLNFGTLPLHNLGEELRTSLSLRCNRGKALNWSVWKQVLTVQHVGNTPKLPSNPSAITKILSPSKKYFLILASCILFLKPSRVSSMSSSSTGCAFTQGAPIWKIITSQIQPLPAILPYLEGTNSWEAR